MSITSNKLLCIYHFPCVDGYTAAWAVHRYFKGEINMYPTNYNQNPPDVSGLDVIIVDFSYKKEVLEEMGKTARSILILDHHDSAQKELSSFNSPTFKNYTWHDHMKEMLNNPKDNIHVLFDMSRSGAGLAWDYFFGPSRPALINHVEDRDLWKYNINGTPEIVSAVESYDFSFENWSVLRSRLETKDGWNELYNEGRSILRFFNQKVHDIIKTQGIVSFVNIGEYNRIPIMNVPKFMCSSVANQLAKDFPFAITYFDSKDKREYSLRTRSNDINVADIARRFGGGGHPKAAGFIKPFNNQPIEEDFYEKD